MAAQAVDMTVSGHINRALFITDLDQEASTKATVKDNASSGTRIRVTGSGETMDGEAAGVNLEYGATDTLGLRYAEVWYSGGYGKISIGQGDQGGEGSVYNGAAAVTGTGHGQDTNGVAKDYYTSLDGGAGRNERLRYDSADLGPISAAVSIGNRDEVSAGLKLVQDLGGTTFKAGIGTIQFAGGQSTISASAGVTLDSGISISGAWGQGTDHGATDPGMLQVASSYAFGDTSVGLSWYQSSDAKSEGSELTAIGAGVNHNLPTLGANVYAAAQNYSVDDGSYQSDDTVVMIGSRIKF